MIDHRTTREEVVASIKMIEAKTTDLNRLGPTHLGPPFSHTKENFEKWDSGRFFPLSSTQLALGRRVKCGTWE